MSQTYTYATQEQVQSALDLMSISDYQMLCDRARLYITGTIYSEEMDLVHEALDRVLNGNRRWPIEVPFTTFLIQCMKSIVSAERNSLLNRHIKTENHFGSLGYDALSILSPKTPSTEEIILQQERLRQLIDIKNQFLAEFFDDPQAQMIINSWGTGLTPLEITSKMGCLRNEYRAASARVDRKVQAHRRKRPGL
ncbi:sigma-70 family RNA polymerase sigma factor [Herbaspirillum aquaticum]|uniref:sigma-70 family RNA polymerase sigma factor n=1 Tax=Herbaspirillum aquaticum TaxID=568783 RepID=UPI001130330D|nr:sigma-70 family RNA polymerase sigma factor [Herbaspirillum aquaticum]